MANFSFDIVSEIDLQEVDNAINQAKKELALRYDLKDTKCSLDYNREEKKIALVADDDFKLRAVSDILATRLAKRGISLKSLIFKEVEKALGGTLRQSVELATGIPKDKAKDLVQMIKGLNLKVQTQIDGEKIKVTSAKKDELQAVIAHLKSVDFPLPLNFCNYR